MMKWQAVYVAQRSMRREIEQLNERIERQESYRGETYFSQVLLDSFTKQRDECIEASKALEEDWRRG